MAKFTEGRGIPCGFILLPVKSTPTYELVFQALKDKVGSRMELQYIKVDFELTVLSALGTVFPATEVTGCPFSETNMAQYRPNGTSVVIYILK